MGWYLMVMLVATAITLWFLNCNSRTLRERGELILSASAEARKIIDSGDYYGWTKTYDVFDRVSYDKHLWYRFTFRNPMRLYDDLANTP